MPNYFIRCNNSGVSYCRQRAPNIVYVVFEMGLVGLLISVAQRHLPCNFCCYMDFHSGVV